MRACLLAASATLLLAGPAQATEYEGTDANYRSLIPMLEPGDVLRLAPGMYSRGLPLDGVRGTEEAPIVITGPETGPRAVILGRTCCNTISLRRVSWVVIRHLDVDGRGEMVDGVKAESDGESVHHVTLEDLDIYNLGDDQQVVGINSKLPAWGWIIRHNTIRDAGTGMYFGNSDGNWPFIGGLIENNLVVNPRGYCMEIKFQVGRVPVADMPTGDSTTIIRNNVFMKYDRATTGADARTNIYVGAPPPSGPGQDDRYEIYGNFFYQNQASTQPLVQGEGNVSFHDNILVNSFGDGAWWVARDGPPKEVNVYNNTIYVARTAVRVSGQDTTKRQLIVGNAIFATTAANGGEARDNATGAPADSVVGPSFDLGSLDLYPRQGRLLGNAIALSMFAGDTDHDRDFNGVTKDGRRRGAYAGEGANPGWTLSEAIKPALGGVLPGADAGVPQADARIPQPDAQGADAGVSSADATVRDASAPSSSDGSSMRDPGTQGPRGTSGGCTCVAPVAADPHLAAAALAFAVAVTLRRRYRTRP